MNQFLRSSVLVSSLIVASRLAYAVPCDTSTDCELPLGNGSAATWTATAVSVNAIENENSVGPTGNAVGSRYYYAATTANLGSTVANGGITTSGTGSSEVGSFATNSSASPTSTVTGGVVSNLLGAQLYYFYAQACPTGVALDGGHCSQWAQIGSKTTGAYPSSVFSSPVAPTDATTNSIAYRTNVPASDVGSVSTINLEVDDLTNSTSQTLGAIGWPGSNGTASITDAQYTDNFIPNTKYQYQGTVTYPYGVAVPTGGPQAEGAFWTTPVQPGPVTAFSVTHCSVKMDAQDSTGATPNPNYTPYSLCAVGTDGSCASVALTGGTQTSLTSTGTINGLDPNTTYSTTAQGIVGNGSDSSANPWNSSTLKSGPSFTTLDWSPSSSVDTITTTGANYNITIGNTAGLTAYEVYLNGVGQGLQSAPVPAIITLTGLTPNTSYTVAIVLHETSCNSSALASQTFVTLPDVPTSFALSIVNARQLSGAWSRAGNPSSGVTYDLQYCLDASFTLGCSSLTTTSTSQAITGLTPETTYYAHVRAESTGGGAPSAYSASDFKMTPNEPPVGPVVAAQIWVTSATLTATSSDNGGPTHLVFVWAPISGGSLTSTAGSTAISGSNAINTTQVIFSGAAAATGSVTVYDHDHDNSSQMKSSSTTWTTSTNRTPTTLSITPATATIATGAQQNFDVSVFDQFGVQIVGSTASWTVASGGGSVSPIASSTYTILTAGGTPGVYQLIAHNGVAVGSATVTESATAPHFVSGPTATVFLTSATFNASATGFNGSGPITYTWSLVSPTGLNVTFTANNSNAASTTMAIFPEATLYTFRCTIVDTTPGYGTPVSQDFPVTVSQVLETLAVSPPSVTIQAGQPKQFTTTGRDQFNLPMSPTITWSATDGTIGSNGVFNDTSLTLGTPVTVRAQSGTVFGTASVTVVSYDLSGAYAYPVPYKANAPAPQGQGVKFTGLGSDAHIRIYTPSGHKVFEIETADGSYLWPIKNSSGENVASGVYFYVIESPDGKKDGKLIVIR